jgi:hypothetical protein
MHPGRVQPRAECMNVSGRPAAAAPAAPRGDVAYFSRRTEVRKWDISIIRKIFVYVN